MNPSTHRAKSHVVAQAGICLVLIAVTLAVFGQVIGFDFVNFDDDVHVYQNPRVADGLTWENLRWAFGIHGPSQWHPLAWISHQLDCQMHGLRPGGHHLTSLLFHVSNVLLLYWFLVRATGALGRSAFVAVLFAIHPLNVESVAWISERRNVLSLFFILLTLLAYSGYVSRRSLPRYLLVLGLFALALMSKPLAVTLPCLLFLLDFWPFRRWNRGQPATGDCALGAADPDSLSGLILEKVPLLLMAGGASLLTIWCQEGSFASAVSLPIGVRVLNALGAYAIYLRKIVWPNDLGVFYPHPGFVSAHPESELLPPALVGGVILLLMTAWPLGTIRSRPYLAVGWFWFLGTLIPMIGVIQVGQQRLADRYMYLPLIGILIAVTWWVAETASAWKLHRSWLQLMGGAAAIACAGLSWMQVGTWENSITLFEQNLRVTEKNPLAHNNLGLALSQKQQPGQALAHFVEALRLQPEYALARDNLGVVLHDQGDPAQAIPHYLEAIRLTPEHVDSHLRLGIAFAVLGQLEQAVPPLQEAVRLAPERPDTHLNLAIALSRKGMTREANQSFRRALELDPNNVKAGYGLAEGLFKLGEISEAKRRLMQVLELAPDFAPARYELEKLLLEKGEQE